MVLEDLRGAIEVSDWPRALSLALVAWRRDRVPALADVVDHISTRLRAIGPAQKRQVNLWWIERAQHYAEADVSGLVATVDQQFGTSEGSGGVIARHATNTFVRTLAALTDRGLSPWSQHLRWLDRLAYILDWHDDPRWSPVLARWLAAPRSPIVTSHRGREIDAGPVVYGAIARRLADLGDARVLPRLQAATDLDATIAALRALPAPSLELAAAIAEIDDLVAPLAAPARDAAVEAALWADVSRAPDDMAPRLVLADYLVERGDPRGEFIALQNTPGGRAEMLAAKLLATHRDRWLGELAPLFTRRGTIWRGGMLYEIRIGTLTTPVRAFDALPDHRELGCVRLAIPSQISPARYAEVVAALPSVTHLIVDTVAVATELAQRRARWPFRILELGTREPGGAAMGDVVAPILDLLAPICPDVVEVIVSPQYRRAPPRPEILDPLVRIREWFPGLQHLRIPQHELEGHTVLREQRFATGYAGVP